MLKHNLLVSSVYFLEHLTGYPVMLIAFALADYCISNSVLHTYSRCQEHDIAYCQLPVPINILYHSLREFVNMFKSLIISEITFLNIMSEVLTQLHILVFVGKITGIIHN